MFPIFININNCLKKLWIMQYFNIFQTNSNENQRFQFDFRAKYIVFDIMTSCYFLK